MLRAFDRVFRKVEVEDFPLISEFMKTALTSLLGKQEIMIKAQLDLIAKFGKEKTPEGMQQLHRLLTVYDLPQLTSVASIITDRLQKLKLFEALIQSENAYEIRGKNSIHNQLAEALWIINDSYWLLHSNEPLTNLLKKKYESANHHERLRPDFICANDKDNLVIVEIKRPSHEITQEDINQLHNYLVAVDDFYQSEFTQKEGYIIGKEISKHNKKYIEGIENMYFKSYTQLVDDCNRRYQEYLDAIEKREP